MLNPNLLGKEKTANCPVQRFSAKVEAHCVSYLTPPLRPRSLDSGSQGKLVYTLLLPMFLFPGLETQGETSPASLLSSCQLRQCSLSMSYLQGSMLVWPGTRLDLPCAAEDSWHSLPESLCNVCPLRAAGVQGGADEIPSSREWLPCWSSLSQPLVFSCPFVCGRAMMKLWPS